MPVISWNMFFRKPKSECKCDMLVSCRFTKWATAFPSSKCISRMKLDQLKNGTYVKLRPLWVRASNLTYTMVSGWRVTASPIALCRSTQPLKVNFNIKKEPQSFIPKVCPHLSSHSSSHKTVSFEDGSSQHPPFFWFAMPLGCKISG